MVSKNKITRDNISVKINKTYNKFRLCSYEGCYEKHYARGLCEKHYDKSKRGTLQKLVRYILFPDIDRRFSIENLYQYAPQHEKINQGNIKDKINKIMHSRILTEREIKVLELRYGLDNDSPKTYKEISEILEVTDARVQQIGRCGLKKIKNFIIDIYE